MVLLERVPGWCGFTVVDNTYLLVKMVDWHYTRIKYLTNTGQVITHLLHIFINHIEPSDHILHHILNLWHITSSIPRTRFHILRWNSCFDCSCYRNCISHPRHIDHVGYSCHISEYGFLDLGANYSCWNLECFVKIPQSNHSPHKHPLHSKHSSTCGGF